jgi:MFS family permease
MDSAEAAPTARALTADASSRPEGGVHWRDTFRALRHRNYQLFFYGQLVSLVGTWMQQTAMSWLVYQVTGSKFLLGTVAAAGSAPMMFFSMWGGSLADRHPKLTILLATQTAEMLLAFALAAAVWSGVAAPWLIIVISLMAGVAMGFEMPARQAFTIELVGKEDLLNAVSLNSSVVNGARVVGPSIAGLLIGSVGPAMCFFLNGVSFVAVIASLLMMQLPKHVPPSSTGSTKAHALGGLAYVANHPRVRTILALFGVVGIFGWSYMVLMPAFARDVLGLGATGYGVLMSASGIGALAGALGVAMAGHMFVPRKIALAGVWLFSAALLAFALNRSFPLALVFLTVSGFGMMLFFSTSNTVLQTIVPDDMRGRVMGVWSVVFGAMIPVGSLEAGALANRIGAPGTIAFGAVVCAVAAVITLVVVRRREAASGAEV